MLRFLTSVTFSVGMWILVVISRGLRLKKNSILFSNFQHEKYRTFSLNVYIRILYTPKHFQNIFIFISFFKNNIDIKMFGRSKDLKM